MLRSFFESNPRAAIAFSGGVDSAYLLFCASKYAEKAAAYYVKSEFQPEFEMEDAIRLAEELKISLNIINLSVLANEAVRKNPPDRCYHCKKAIFSAIKEKAMEDGFTLLLDGSNMDDNPAERPGMRILEELSVRSPLREAGLYKSDIRKLSQSAGLFTYDKPSYSCLATRIPTGCEITEEMLKKTEAGEKYLFSLGFTDFRLRWRNGGAKLELKKEQLVRAAMMNEELLAGLGQYYSETVLDLKTR